MFRGQPKLRRGFGFLILGAISVGASLPAGAHTDLDIQIALATKSIERKPTDAHLYLFRGELHRVNLQWDLALKDFDRAASLDGSIDLLDFYRAKTLYQADRAGQALPVLERFLTSKPDVVEALRLHAQVLAKLGRLTEASKAYDRLIMRVQDSGNPPMPEDYLERARALSAMGDERLEEAVRGLDEGLALVGQAVTMQFCAIDLELKRKNFDAALRRLDQIAPQFGRKDSIDYRRGSILEEAGRLDEARVAYEQALAGIVALRPARRRAKSTAELESDIRAALGRITNNEM